MTATNTGKGYSTEVAVSSLLQTAAVCHNNAGGSEELMSDSERTNAGEDKRRCVCHMGDACRIMSTAFAVTNDPRGYHVQVPTKDYNLRKAYCRYLCPHDEVPSSNQPGDDFTVMNVAVHHFHPKVIFTYFNTNMEDREEDGEVLPLPTRVMTIKEQKSFGMHLDDNDRVVDPATGRPSQPRLYHIVPSYSFDMAHSNLKESMTFMQQVALDKCVRRMRREARRQKWEMLANSWQKTSEQNLNTLKKLSKASDVADTLLGKGPVPLTIANTADSLLGTKVPVKPPTSNVAATRQKAMDMPSVVFPRENTAPPSEMASEKAKDLQERSPSLTAQEVLESEMEDDDSVPDLNSLEGSTPTNTDGSEDDSTEKTATPISTTTSKEVAIPTTIDASEEDSAKQTSTSKETEELDTAATAKSTKNTLPVKKGKEKLVIETTAADSNKKEPTKIPTRNAPKQQKAGEEILVVEIPASAFNGSTKNSLKKAQSKVTKVSINTRVPVPKSIYQKQKGSVKSAAPVVSVKKPVEKLVPTLTEKDLTSKNVIAPTKPTNKALQQAATEDSCLAAVAAQTEKEGNKNVAATSKTDTDIQEMKAGPPSHTLRNALIGIYFGALTVTGVYVYHCTQLLASREEALACLTEVALQ